MGTAALPASWRHVRLLPSHNMATRGSLFTPKSAVGSWWGMPADGALTLGPLLPLPAPRLRLWSGAALQSPKGPLAGGKAAVAPRLQHRDPCLPGKRLDLGPSTSWLCSGAFGSEMPVAGHQRQHQQRLWGPASVQLKRQQLEKRRRVQGPREPRGDSRTGPPVRSQGVSLGPGG